MNIVVASGSRTAGISRLEAVTPAVNLLSLELQVDLHHLTCSSVILSRPLSLTTCLKETIQRLLLPDQRVPDGKERRRGREKQRSRASCHVEVGVERDVRSSG